MTAKKTIIAGTALSWIQKNHETEKHEKNHKTKEWLGLAFKKWVEETRKVKWQAQGHTASWRMETEM